MIFLFTFDLSFIQPGCKFQREALGNDYKYDNDSDSAVHDISLIALISEENRNITHTASADYPYDGGIRYQTDTCCGKTENKGSPRRRVKEFPHELRPCTAHGPCCFKYCFWNIMQGLLQEPCIECDCD